MAAWIKQDQLERIVCDGGFEAMVCGSVLEQAKYVEAPVFSMTVCGVLHVHALRDIMCEGKA